MASAESERISMEKSVWVINDNRTELIELQHIINASGSMRAVCIRNHENLQKVIDKNKAYQDERPAAVVIERNLIIPDFWKVCISMRVRRLYI